METMKKINAMMMFAVVTAALVSCNKEKDLASDQNGEGIRISVTASMPETRTILAEDGKTVNWTTTDKVGFINGKDQVNVESSPAVLDGEGRASFTGTVPSEGTYYAYYPYFNDGSYAPNAEGVTVRVPDTQHPTLTSFDPAADLLVSEAFNVTAASSYSTDPATLRFRRLGAFIKVHFVDNTSKRKLAGKYAASVSIQGENNLVGRFRISGTEGLVNQNSGFKKVTAVYAAETFAVTSSNAWFGVAPQTFAIDSKLTVTVNIDGADVTKVLTLPKDVVLGAGNILPIKVTFDDSDLPAVVTRVWGKYSSSAAYWNESFGGTPSSDRNIAMDGEYIYLPETTAGAKMWMIPVDGKSDPVLANVEGVSGGTHALSCVRMIPNTSSSVNDGKPFLMGVSLTVDDNTPMKVYSWANGVSSAPTATSASTWCGRRLGDKFTVYGTLQDGGLFFKDWNNVNNQGAFMVLRTAWSVAPSDGLFNPRRTNMVAEGGIGAYYPYPDDVMNGIYASVSSAAYFVSFTSSPLTTSPNESGSFTAASGYYSSTAGYNFITFNDKKYIAYVKNAGDGDGRFYILEGDLSDSWSDLLGSKRNVIFQADIQQDLAYSDGEYHEDLASGVTKTSAHSALDCSAFVTEDAVYFAALKQGVGLSLFKLSK